MKNLFDFDTQSNLLQSEYEKVRDLSRPLMMQSGQPTDSFFPFLRQILAYKIAYVMNRRENGENEAQKFFASVASDMAESSHIVQDCGNPANRMLVKEAMTLPVVEQRRITRSFPCKHIADQIAASGANKVMQASVLGYSGLVQALGQTIRHQCPVLRLVDQWYHSQSCILEGDLFTAAGLLEQLLVVL